MNASVTLNTEQQLFVISRGDGYSCFGFKNLFDDALELAMRLLAAGRKVIVPLAQDIGTMFQYAQYEVLMGEYQKINDPSTWFNARTPQAVRDALESCRHSGIKVRVYKGDTETGRDWMGEFDTIGRIGRSMGPQREPLLVPEGECGGGALLTHCILRIVNVNTGRDVYRHPMYHQPQMELAEPGAGAPKAYKHGAWVTVDGERRNYANFKTQRQADAYLNFMTGVTNRPPKF